MAKAKRKGGAKKAKRGAKAARKTTARKPVRKSAARKRTAKKAARKSGGTKAAPRRRTSPTPGIGKAKGGPRRAVPLANPRGSSGPGTNPMPTKRSTGTAAGAGVSRSPYLERQRRRLREIEETVPTPPSSLDLDRHASAARTGREELREALKENTAASPAITGGDVDADWQQAYFSGDEAAGGDNPTPDQSRVEDVAKALGVEYADNEELEGVEKIDKRDRKRWELDPASAEDYRDRQK